MLKLGIEIGGTKLQVGVGRGSGELLTLVRGQVEAASGALGIRSRLHSLVDEAVASAGCDWSQIAAIGIGFGGPVDFASQTTPQDRVALVVTQPLTTNEAWTAFRPGELRVFVGGEASA